MGLKHDKKRRDAAIAIAVALAIALPGTFAWQSISQQALNEAVAPDNPGGRLHDDFSGWQAGDTKDIYVENFGGKIIYARIRLDEYMEIGEGAGLKGEDAVKNVKIVGSAYNPTANINDVTTWSTHIPGDTPEIEIDKPLATDPDDPTKPLDPNDPRGHDFHDYWDWTMGGQDVEGNPDGKTIYMPTFNKNKDSLSSDINGTLDGTKPGDTIYYDDYHEYVLDEEADRVRDETKTTIIEGGTENEVYLVPNGAFYDADDNTADEMTRNKSDPMYGYDIYGNGGEVNINYQVNEEIHKAKETQSGSVMLMTEWDTLTEEEKKNTYAWVYDKDGWAYWSQPIKPNTATGLLLDRIELKNELDELWYYGINAVAQFITADSLGSAENQKGFYSPGGRPPTKEALDLLESIGVKVNGEASGTLSIEAFNEEGIPVQSVSAGQAVYLSLDGTGAASFYLSDQRHDDAWIWTLEGNTSIDTYLTDQGILIVGPDEQADYLLITVQSGIDEAISGALALTVEGNGATASPYTAVIMAEEDTVAPGGNLMLYGAIEGSGESLILNAEFNWSLDSTERTYAEDTCLIPNGNSAILNVGAKESGVITVIAAPKYFESMPDVIARFTATVVETGEPTASESPPAEESPMDTALPTENIQPSGTPSSAPDAPNFTPSPEPSGTASPPPAESSPEPSGTASPPPAESSPEPGGTASPPPAESAPEPSETATPPPAESAPEPGESTPSPYGTDTRPGGFILPHSESTPQAESPDLFSMLFDSWSRRFEGKLPDNGRWATKTGKEGVVL